MRARAVNGHLRVLIAGEFDDGFKLVQVADMLEILLLIGGVHADEYVVIGDFVDQDVVYKTAVLVEQSGILRLANLKLGDGVGGEKIGCLDGFHTQDFDFAHVADVEQAHRLADGVVFFDNAGILHGHIPAAEIDHPGSHRTMDGIERRTLERRGHGQRPI